MDEDMALEDALYPWLATDSMGDGACEGLPDWPGRVDEPDGDDEDEVYEYDELWS